jgi:hypothetical protein
MIEEIKSLVKFVRESELSDAVKEGLIQGIQLQASGAPASKYLEFVQEFAKVLGETDEN